MIKFKAGDFITNPYYPNTLYYIMDFRIDPYMNRYKYEIIRIIPKHGSPFIWPDYLLADFVKADNRKIIGIDDKPIYIKA